MSVHKGNAELSVNCVVKGYHECNFEVHTAEEFLATRKRGPRGGAFRLSNKVFNCLQLVMATDFSIVCRLYCIILSGLKPQLSTIM